MMMSGMGWDCGGAVFLPFSMIAVPIGVVLVRVEVGAWYIRFAVYHWGGSGWSHGCSLRLLVRGTATPYDCRYHWDGAVFTAAPFRLPLPSGWCWFQDCYFRFFYVKDGAGVHAALSDCR